MVLLGIGPAAGGAEIPGLAENSPAVSPGSTNDDSQNPKGIQVGLFKSAANAKKLADHLKSKGFQTLVEAEKNSSSRWKVTVLIPAGKNPQPLIVKLKDLGIEGFLSF